MLAHRPGHAALHAVSPAPADAVEAAAAASTAEVLAELATLVAAGDLHIPIASTYPVEQIRQAYTHLAQRHTHGKIVLALTDQRD